MKALEIGRKAPDFTEPLLSIYGLNFYGDWQTTKLVPFSAKLNFNKGNYSSDNLILEKDNPSRLSKNSDYLIIPVKFKTR